MIYERYERYEQRMLMLLKVLKWIKKYYKIITIPLAVATVAALSFLAVVGTFFETPVCSDCVYGEYPQVQATAFLSDVYYEYCPADGEGTWSADRPSQTGTYMMRAVSKNGFGYLRYSEAQAFFVMPAELSFSYPDISCVYGEQEETVLRGVKPEGLLAGDSVEEIQCEFDLSSGDRIGVQVTSFRVVNRAGVDVTSCYHYQPSEGYWRLQKRSVTVTTEGATKEYDGTPLRAEGFHISSGSLLMGHALRAVYSVDLTDVGRVLNEASFTVKDASGKEVTEFYDIQVIAGELSVTPRAFSVKSVSGEWVYDGSAHSKHGYEITAGALVTGHKIKADFDAAIRYVGAAQNTFTCAITDANGRDVTVNYDISYEYGTLSVEPIVLRFQTGSAEKVYDGTPLTSGEWKQISGTLASGDYFATIRTVGAQTDAGTEANKLSVTVVDAGGKDITAKAYKIEVDAGELKVTPRRVTITSSNAEKYYDGLPLIERSYFYQPTAFVTNHYPTTSFTGSQTAVGSSENFFTAKVIDSSQSKDVSHNYEIVYKYGLLTVLPNPDMPEKGACDGSCGGTCEEHRGEDGEGGEGGEGGSGGTTLGGPMEQDDDRVYAAYRYYLRESVPVYFREKSYGNYTGSGWTEGEATTVSTSHSPLFFAGTQMQVMGFSHTRLELTMAEFCPTIVPYYLTYRNGEDANLTGNDISLSSPSKSYYTFIQHMDEDQLYDLIEKSKTRWYGNANERKQYEAFVYENYLDVPASTKTALLALAAENGIVANSSTLITDIQEYISHAAKYRLDIEEFPEGADRVIHFLTVTKEGYCQHFASAATLMFRAFGIPARYTVGFMSMSRADYQEVEITGQNAHAWVEIYLDNIGWIPLEVTAALEGTMGTMNGQPVLLAPDGKIMITVSTYSAEKVFDSHQFEEYQGEKYRISYGWLLKGHSLIATVKESRPGLAYPGTSVNVLELCRIVDSSGKDVTDMYHIEVIQGESVILKRPITIVSASAEKIYDGMVLSDGRWWCYGGLAPGHKLNVTVTGSIQRQGVAQNTFTWSIVNEKNGSDQSYCYDVTVVYGTLNNHTK